MDLLLLLLEIISLIDNIIDYLIQEYFNALELIR